MFISRRPRGPDRYLRLKTTALLAGIGIALLGFELDSRWIVGLAMVVVAAGFLLRFLERGS